METYKDLKDRCYNIKDKFLSSVFAKFGMNDLHKIIFFLIHKQEIYYFGIMINENWFNQLLWMTKF